MEELKKRIVDKATQLFLKQGPKGVTMDQVSDDCGISKRTLYQNFKDKNELLLVCLEHIHLTQNEKRTHLKQTSENVIEFFILATKEVIEQKNKFNSNFFYEIQKFFPAVADYHNSISQKVLIEDLSSVLEEGIKAGYFRKEIKINVSLWLLKGQIDLLYFSDIVTKINLSFSETFQCLISLFLRGIATPEGLEVLSRYEKTWLDS
ncbi:TetR/AcrR family transcriptional regulator [Adhaeribacter aquaticus]|uniref:TetR/AcrR family transcriptional regulator n=1 Tax=Adhaeribacter aquaticus TaxID=299567 RepID=UPI00040C32CA|nr:TetR/AcrR family transcriptional regulator [Adhaeribacter aquaticus]